MDPQLSVVLITYNRRRLLARTLPSVFAQDLPADQFEVIVVADGCTDDTVDYLRTLNPSCGFRVVQQANGGHAVARNAGVAAARGRVVLFTDDDIVFDPASLRAHLAAHQCDDSIVAHGPVLISPDSPDTLAAEWQRHVVADETQRWQNGFRWPDDANVDANYSVGRAAFLACGGFDETFTRARSNTELGWRLWQTGFQFRYEPKALAYHLYDKPSDQVVRRQALSWGRNDVLLYRKYNDLRRFSGLARLAAGSRRQRLSRRAAAQFPMSPDVFLKPIFRIAEMFRRLPVARRIGLKLLALRMNTSYWRGAVTEAGSWNALKSEFGARLPVLMYHHIGPSRPGTSPLLTVSPKRFERHVRWLARRGYVGIRASDWLSWCRGGTGLPHKPVLFTFDDGYADVAEYALPVLRRYGFSGVVFLVTGRVGGTNVWDESRWPVPHRLMTEEQIRYWTGQGIEFGAHSRTHPDLTTLAASELKEEVEGSAKDMEQLNGTRAVSFAYPYGPYNECVCASVRGAFDLAFTTDDGINTLETGPDLLQRNMVFPNDSIVDLELLLHLGWNPMRYLRSKVRVRSRLRSLKRSGFGDSL